MPENADEIKDLLVEATYYEIESINHFFKYFCESVILNRKQVQDLNILCKFKDTNRWELIYRTNFDAFYEATFHPKCDNFLKYTHSF